MAAERIERLVAFQLVVGLADAHLFLVRGVGYVGEPDVNEPGGSVTWIELEDLPALIADGRVVEAASVIGPGGELLDDGFAGP